MKIALDYQIFSNQRYGGISRYFVRLAQELMELDQQVNVFAPLHQNAYVVNLPAQAVKGYGVAKYPPKSGRFLRFVNQGISGLLINRWTPDIVHETYYNRFASGKKRYPRVITVYDMIHERLPECHDARDNTREIKRIAVERADVVIAISEHTRKDLIELYSMDPEKVVTVHLGFDNFETLSSGVSELSTTQPDKPYLLYVGNRATYKNFDNLIRAYAASTWLQSHFAVVAFGGGSFTSQERNLFADLKIDPSQIIYRSGGDRLLGTYYRNAAAFVYPSRYEGFGIPPLEAMAHDCPVIASQVSSIPEIVGGAGSYFDPESVDSMRAVLEQTLESEQSLNALRKLGRHRLAEFSWEKCAKSTLQVYQQVL